LENCIEYRQQTGAVWLRPDSSPVYAENVRRLKRARILKAGIFGVAFRLYASGLEPTVT